MRLIKNCLHCNKELTGRTDKKYCDSNCKSSHQYKREKQRPERFYNKVDNQLRLNRKLLKEYNRAGKATVRSSILIHKGFNPKFFTHYWKNQKGDIYLFVYEYGFLKRNENGIKKYVLIQWQDYMN
ncbi:MAG: hypothetical protein HKP48_11470 [Winogradskyella sp.]|uniref:hypothetical protein n=1 Tax=Winogradskyella sp. TaxID=1883156 RepID=UPI0017AD27B0|nr:hypothetical protein [Winogradskyella sp.]MBT8244702.1 hypothetical protein [Winogradskyella sp.]NNK23877.1 hypothetical protein [Winogradskyella sp.]